MRSSKPRHKTHFHKVKLPNGYLQVWLRHNQDYTDKWRKGVLIECWIFKGREFFDADRLAIVSFNDYLPFKKFKDALKTSK